MGIHDREQEIEIHENQKSFGRRIRPEVQVRAKMVYPKNESKVAPFRFPMIPDDIQPIHQTNSSQPGKSVKEPQGLSNPRRDQPNQRLRTSNQRSFRFPIIPDHMPSRSQPLSTTRMEPYHRNQRRGTLGGMEDSTPEEIKMDRPSFHPTPIVSPIHGSGIIAQSAGRRMDGFVHTGRVEEKGEQVHETMVVQETSTPVPQPSHLSTQEIVNAEPGQNENIVSPIHESSINSQNAGRKIDNFVYTGRVEGEEVQETIDPVPQQSHLMVKEIAGVVPHPNDKGGLVHTVKTEELTELVIEEVAPVKPVEQHQSFLQTLPVQENQYIQPIEEKEPDNPMSNRDNHPTSSDDMVEVALVKPSLTVERIPSFTPTPSVQENQLITYETKEPEKNFSHQDDHPKNSHDVAFESCFTTPSPVYTSKEIMSLPSVRDGYQFPSIHYLQQEPPSRGEDDAFTDEQMEKLYVALTSFNVNAEIIGVVKGPTVTRYEVQPAPGVKVNKFTNLVDDIKLALAAKDIRMEAPIPGRSAIGIEVPNEIALPVYIRSIVESQEFQSNPSPLAVALGRDIGGAPVIADLKKMPHGLIAGSTGSGKSVCINSILVSLMYKAKPSEVRLILVDPKVVELAPYNHIPHLLTPVVTDPKQATGALRWAVEEMDSRYEKFADKGTRDIERYNQMAQQEGMEKLPYIVIIIDELADLMMVAPGDVEEAICRIAQKARACGIHLLLATQRPSVDVITGLIKANIPTRIAFAVSSAVDSRTILDMGGAERLLGKGDMLYYPSGMAKPIRLQGNFVSDDEIEMVVDHVKKQQKVQYLFDKETLVKSALSGGTDGEDDLFEEALLFVVEQGQASASSLQRRFRIGYNRAARLIDMMENEGYISGQLGSKPREVLISEEDYRDLFG